MNTQYARAETYPGIFVNPPPQPKPAVDTIITPTCFTLVTDYRAVKHLVSPRPLRRPNRTRPL